MSSPNSLFNVLTFVFFNLLAEEPMHVCAPLLVSVNLESSVLGQQTEINPFPTPVPSKMYQKYDEATPKFSHIVIAHSIVTWKW